MGLPGSWRCRACRTIAKRRTIAYFTACIFPCYAGLMKALFLLGCLGLGILKAQTSPAPQPPAVMPNLPDETVLATFPDGTTLTMAQFKALFAALPPNLQ